jgi:hypothetical protein
MGGGVRIVRSLCSQLDALIPKPSLSLAIFAGCGASWSLVDSRQGLLKPIGLKAGQQFGGAQAHP